MSHEIVRAVDAGVAGAEDLLPRQVGDRVADGVRVAQVQELDALLAVVEDQLVVEGQSGGSRVWW
jgi:hypothetical protein